VSLRVERAGAVGADAVGAGAVGAAVVRPRQIATSGALLLIENLIRLGATAAVSFWIARRLGPSQFGILNFASALMAIFLSAAALGMDTPVILRLTRTERPGSVIGAALFIRAISSTAAFAIAITVAWLLKRGDPLALGTTLIVSASILVSIPSALDYWFKARTIAGAPALARLSGTLVSVGAKIACLLLGLGLLALAWTVVLEAMIASLGLMLAYRWESPGNAREGLSLDRRLVQGLLVQSLPYLYSGVAVILYMKIDIVMLSYFSSNAETGIYSLAQKLSEVLYVVPVVLIESAFPSLAKRSLIAGRDNSRDAQTLFDLATGGALLVTLVSVLIAAPVIDTLFGDRYGASVHIFQLHAWSCIAIAMNSARNRWLAVVGLQRYAPTVTSIGVVVNVAMNLLLIPAFGGMGAAVSTVASYFASGYFTSFMFPRLRALGHMQTRALWPWFRLIALRDLSRAA
jgi:PST family polysaccharide transporter